MTALTLERLRTEGERFSEAVARESFLAHAGYKAEAELAPIYTRYAAVTGGDALSLALELFRGASRDEEKRSARALLEWQLEANTSRELVALDEREITWEGKAAVRVGAREIPYQRATIEIANTTDRGQRQAIDDARTLVAGREHGPLRRERIQREKQIVESLGIADGYLATFAAASGVQLEKLSSQCAEFLRDTQPMWDDVLAYYLRKSLGLRNGEATRADALRLFRMADFDEGFPTSDLARAVRGQVTEMGLDPDAGGRITFDLAEREGKRARAFCAPVRVPDEVYLVLRPHGGQNDYTALLHELGHALHFASVDGSLPFEFRWLGDNSVTETYAMLFDHLLHDARWLARFTALRRPALAEFRRMIAFEELHFIRRYCGKLLYELEVYGPSTNWSTVADAYVERLTHATGFAYRSEDAFVDLDHGFYSARYLRAWQLQALLRQTLTERFDEDWFRNPAAGPWLAGELLARGQRDTADEIATSLGHELSFAPLRRAIEAGLQS